LTDFISKLNYTDMGKGDKKTRKGKIAMGSFGKRRPHNLKKHKPAEAATKEDKS
jgi:30S ribosomal protein S31